MLSTAINLLMFWNLGDKATDAQKKAVSEGFDVRKRTLELTQLRKKRDDARREEDAKRAETEINTENLKEASETTRTASQKAQEVMKQSDTSRQAITEAERKNYCTSRNFGNNCITQGGT